MSYNHIENFLTQTRTLNFVHEFLIVEEYDFAVVCSSAGTKTAHVGFFLLNLAK